MHLKRMVRVIIFVVTVLILNGCTSSNDKLSFKIEESTIDIPLNTVLTYSYSDKENAIVFNDDNKTYEMVFKTDGEVSYRFQHNEKLLFSGNGGLFVFDAFNHSLEKISDETVVEAGYLNDRLYYIENTGYNSEKGEYQSRLVYDNRSYIYPYYINQVAILDNKLYMTCYLDILNSEETALIQTNLDNFDNGEFSVTAMEEEGVVYNFDGQIYLVSNQSAVNISTNNIISFAEDTHELNHFYDAYFDDTIKFATTTYGNNVESCIIIDPVNNTLESIDKCKSINHTNDHFYIVNMDLEIFEYNDNALTDLNVSCPKNTFYCNLYSVNPN